MSKELVVYENPEDREECPNCGTSYLDGAQFCHVCGQERKEVRVSLKRLIADFFENYFSVDSRFVRSIVPLMIRPGVLTLRFMEGYRRKYANPIRLYLFLSFFYFLTMSLGSENSRIRVNMNPTNDEQSEKARIQLDSLESIRIDTLSGGWQERAQLRSQKNIARLALMDNVHQLRVLLKGMPLSFILMMPLIALFIYWSVPRKRFLYVDTLVYTIHLQSFSMALSILMFIPSVFIYISPAAQTVVGLGLGMVYSVISYRKVFERKWITSIVVSVVYSIVSLILLILFSALFFAGFIYVVDI